MLPSRVHVLSFVITLLCTYKTPCATYVDVDFVIPLCPVVPVITFGTNMSYVFFGYCIFLINFYLWLI
jgi:hypothetical protein